MCNIAIPFKIHFLVADQTASTTIHTLPKERHGKADKPDMTKLQTLYTQSHNRVDYIIVVLLQRIDSLLPRDACLGHDQFNILVLKT